MVAGKSADGKQHVQFNLAIGRDIPLDPSTDLFDRLPWCPKQHPCYYPPQTSRTVNGVHTMALDGYWEDKNKALCSMTRSEGCEWNVKHVSNGDGNVEIKNVGEFIITMVW